MATISVRRSTGVLPSREVHRGCWTYWGRPRCKQAEKTWKMADLSGCIMKIAAPHPTRGLFCVVRPANARGWTFVLIPVGTGSFGFPQDLAVRH